MGARFAVAARVRTLRSPRAHAAILAAAGLLLAHTATATPMSMLQPAADQAGEILHIWDLMLWVCGFFYVLVLGFVGWMIVRALHRRGQSLAPVLAPPSDRPLGVTLAVWAAMITLGLFVLAIGSFLVDRQLLQGKPDLTVRVTGNQWWWQVEYEPDDPAKRMVTANELHLPLGKTVLVELASRDVIHSLWIPNLNGKTDLIPGRTNHLRLTPRQAGVFRGGCAEFCGLQHAKMALDVTVEPPDRFAAWWRHQMTSAAAPATALATKGEQVFMTSACVLCHTVRGIGAGSNNGPDLTHLASRRSLAAGALPMNRGALAAWLADPQQQKPGTNMPFIGLEPDALNALVDYLAGLQ